MSSRDGDQTDPVAAAFAVLRTTPPPPDAADRIRRRVAVTPQRKAASAPMQLVALAAAIVVAIGTVATGALDLGRMDPTQAPPPASASGSGSPPSAVPSKGPTVSPPPSGIVVGGLARATRDVQIASIVTVLAGQTVYVVDGPVNVVNGHVGQGGVPSWRLQVFGDLRNGYRPAGVMGWLSVSQAADALVPRNPICPTKPLGIVEIAAIQPHERMLCFGDRDLTFGPVTASSASFGPGLSDRWLSVDGNPEFVTGLPYLVPDAIADIKDGTWVTVTGHFNDAGSAGCGEAEQVVFCREQFHITAVAPAPVPEFVQRGTWRPIRDAPIPGRSENALVWTEKEAVVWGGLGDSSAVPPRGGAAYDPATDQWRTIPDAPIPGRSNPISAWTGSEVLVFGGLVGDTSRLDGAAWNPTTNRWQMIAKSPLSGVEARGAWVEDRLIVVTSTSAASYDPATNRWTVLPAAPVRVGWRSAAEAAGRLVVVAFGDGATPPVDWAAFDPVSGAWTSGRAPIDPLQAGVTFVGAGDRVAVPETGQTFDPRTATWASGVRCDRTIPGGVWTGRVVLGFHAAWDQAADRCLTVPEAPLIDRYAVGVWTGSEYLVWSGNTAGEGYRTPRDGAIFRPAP